MKGVLFDRALTRKWLDLTLELAASGKGLEDAKLLLEVSLRDDVPSTTGRLKTRTALARVWLDPPEPARQLIEWGVRHQEGATEAWHIGAMLATYPFFADVCRFIGSSLDRQAEVDTAEVARKLRGSWGDREVVDVSVRSTVRTLREFGTLTGSPRSSKSARGAPVEVPATGPLHGWLGHALLVARRVEEIESGDLRRAPELFLLALPTGAPNGYPLIEKFTEGGGRAILRAKTSTDTNSQQKEPRQLTLSRSQRASKRNQIIRTAQETVAKE